MGVVTALGVGVETNWQRLHAGVVGILPMKRFRPEKYTTSVAAEIPEHIFAALRGGAASGDCSRAQLLATAASREALAHQDFAPETTSLVLSTTKADFDDFEATMSESKYGATRRFNPYVFALGLATDLGLGGPVCAVSNACASGLVAVVHAARILDRGAATHALVVGVDTLTDFVIGGFSSLRALSPVPARPFDASRSGLSLGEGAGALLLTAVPSGNSFATFLGAAITNDAEHITAPSKEGRGLRKAIDVCLRRADRSLGDIDYINAHGTGTLFNDEMECQALHHLFADSPQPPLTSMKGSFGHTLGAAGIVEAILSIQAMRSGALPPSTGYEAVGVSHPLNISARALDAPNMNTILCLKSGFGGVNAVVAFGREGAA